VEAGQAIEEAEEENVGEDGLEHIPEEDAVEDASETDEIELDESEDGKQDLAISHASVDDSIAPLASRPNAAPSTGSLIRHPRFLRLGQHLPACYDRITRPAPRTPLEYPTNLEGHPRLPFPIPHTTLT